MSECRYTQGINKILISKIGDLFQAFEMADKVGYEAVCHNGMIYVKARKHKNLEGNWRKTPFTIDDFMF